MALKLSKKNNKVQKIVKSKRKKSTRARVVSSTSMTVDPSVTLPTGKYIEAVGRRKVATARVRIYEDGGDFVVNGKVVGKYFVVFLSTGSYIDIGSNGKSRGITALATTKINNLIPAVG